MLKGKGIKVNPTPSLIKLHKFLSFYINLYEILRMARFLKQLIEEEGISQAELSRESRISTTTINKICTKNLNGGNVSPTTKGKLTKAINKILGSQKYKIQDIKFI